MGTAVAGSKKHKRWLGTASAWITVNTEIVGAVVAQLRDCAAGQLASHLPLRLPLLPVHLPPLLLLLLLLLLPPLTG
jgi:hypothetical protein